MDLLGHVPANLLTQVQLEPHQDSKPWEGTGCSMAATDPDPLLGPDPPIPILPLPHCIPLSALLPTDLSPLLLRAARFCSWAFPACAGAGSDLLC